MQKALGIVFFISFILVSCRWTSDNRSGKDNVSGGGVTYARHFAIEVMKDYKILTVFDPWQGAKGVAQRYCLLESDKVVPDGFSDGEIIRVPIRRIISMSTTYLSMISELGADSSIAGISGLNLLYDEKTRERVKAGRISDVGYEDNLNKEMVISLKPDLVMVYGVGSESSGYLSKLRELGVAIMFNADYLEDLPLGKAEWIKVFGALYCMEEKADEIFRKTETEYNNIRATVARRLVSRPKVLLGLPWKDIWYVSPGNSFVSSLIRDAGGDYLWSDTESDYSIPSSVESVWLKANEAEYWLNIGSVGNKEEILNTDHRLADLPCMKKGNLYNNNKRIRQEGGNDYWESGSIYPQIVLKDIASILHPGLFTDYELYYYRRVEK